jgi:TolA-binding protein
MRLAKEREGAWSHLGRWDFAASDDPAPFNLPSWAWCGEQVGQVHHPELGGMLLGGYGLQVYPLDIEAGDDVRITIDFELIKGEEFWLLARGTDPANCYQFRIGAFEGRWLAICRALGGTSPTDAELLSMRPVRNGTSTRVDRQALRHRLKVECEGSALRLHLDDDEPLVFRDLHPISVAPGRHLGLATWKTQAAIRSISVERRHRPVMLPAYAVGNEMLRHGLLDAAIAAYDRFLAEHPTSDLAPEAAFMRCMARVHAGDPDLAIGGLRAFLSDHLEHALASDALFTLARVQLERPNGNMRTALRELLAYQESGDVVRTRFALWLMPHLAARIEHSGLGSEIENDLELLARLMRGSPDEAALMATISRQISTVLRQWLNGPVDRNDGVAIAACRESMRRLRGMGYAITVREPLLVSDYARLAGELARIEDPGQTVMYIGRGEDRPTTLFDFVRDSFALIGMGADRIVLAALDGEEITPVERILRAGLRRRLGDEAGTMADLTWCFQLTDQLETSRTSLVMLFAARLGCVAMGFLPPQVVIEGLTTIRADLMHGPLLALTAWTCEHHGQGEIADEYRVVARTLYRTLSHEGTGFALVARQGLERLGPGDTITSGFRH